MQNESATAALTALEKQELLQLLKELDVSIVQVNPHEWQFVQKCAGDGCSQYSANRYVTEDQAILAAAENWSI